MGYSVREDVSKYQRECENAISNNGEKAKDNEFIPKSNDKNLERLWIQNKCRNFSQEKKHHKKPDQLAQKNLHTSAFYSGEKSYIVANISHVVKSFDDLEKLWQSHDKIIHALDFIQLSESIKVKIGEKMENKIKFSIGVGIIAAVLVLIIVIYGYIRGWFGIEHEVEVKAKEEKQLVKEKDENKISKVKDDIITKEKSFENLIAFPNGTIIDKRVLERELHLKHLENMRKISHKHEIEKHSNELRSKEITTISTVSVVAATIILVGLMCLGHKIVSKKRNKVVKKNDSCEMNTFEIKHNSDHPITPGKQERLLSANTKENEKQLKMEIRELEELAGKLEKEIHDKKHFGPNFRF